ncbi:COG0523 Putative GTPases (G3E family) [Rhabdaerophilaceae bacterium]
MDERLAPIPLTVITGFLGAGKTTRLNRWLADPTFSDTLVIINEFGSVGLDHLLVEKAEGDMVLMAAGCLCCTIRGDLVATLEDLLRRRDNARIRVFRRVVIETTGLADPLPILQAIIQHPYLSKRFVIASIVTLVDAVHGASTLEAHIEARRQVALADALILSKGDLATPDTRMATEAAVAALNPHAHWLEGSMENSADALTTSRFLPDKLDDNALLTWLGENQSMSHQPGHDPNSNGGSIEAHGFVSDEAVDASQLIVFREAMRLLLGPRLLRMKGLVRMAEHPEKPVLIHHVQSVADAPVTLGQWPSRDRRTRIVIIAQDVDKAVISGFWEALTRRILG